MQVNRSEVSGAAPAQALDVPRSVPHSYMENARTLNVAP